MARSLERVAPQGRGITVFERPLAGLTPALRVATQIRERDYHEISHRWLGHDRSMVAQAKEAHSKYLAKFGAAERARRVLSVAIRWDPPQRKTAGAMVGALLGGFGAKADRNVLAAMLDMLSSDQIGIGSGLWQPMYLSSASLALACRKLMVTSKFTPKPAELHDACVEAHRKLHGAHSVLEEFTDYVRRCDAVLLEFDHAEWQRPYRTSEHQPILEEMLRLHAICGDGSNAWDDREYDDNDNPLHPFEQIVQREQAKLLALPAPEPTREAACDAKPARRTSKQKPKPAE